MGGSLSKASKPKAMRTLRSPTLKPSPSLAESHPAVSFLKSPQIHQDGIDPQLDQMLRKLGPVHVPKLATTFQDRNNMIRILQNREAIHDEHSSEGPLLAASDPRLCDSATRNSSSLPPNRLTLSKICDLLDQKKIKPLASLQLKELSGILGDQKIDSESLNWLMKTHNTISVKLVKNPDPHNDEPIQMAIWVPQPR